MLEKLLESKCLVVVGKIGGKREELAKKIVAHAAAKGLSTIVLDNHGLFRDLPLEPTKPFLPYRSVSAYLPLALSSLPGPHAPGAEMAAAEAIGNSPTLSTCLAKLASRTDAGARTAYLKLSLLSKFIADNDIQNELKNSVVELSVAPTLCRKALTLLWISYLKERNKPLPEVIVVGEGGFNQKEGRWAWPLLEELVSRGVTIVLLDRAVRRQHLQHTIVLADVTLEARMGILRYRLPALPEDAVGQRAVVIDDSISTFEID